MDSSVDVCDLMINLLCAECPDRECADDKSDDDGEPIWSHSKLMNCIREKWVREELVKLDDSEESTVFYLHSSRGILRSNDGKIWTLWEREG